MTPLLTVKRFTSDSKSCLLYKIISSAPTNLATSAPSSLAAGSMWVDSSSAGTHTVKYYDGSDSITLFNINTSANTVDFID